MGTLCALDKELFLASLECPARGWRLRRGGPEEKPGPGALMRMEEGKQVHSRARALFKTGVFAAGGGDSAGRTRALMADPANATLFEGAFAVGNLVARADILLRQRLGWEVIEIKSSVNFKDEHKEDLAFTVLVLRRAGVEVVKASVMLLSRDYRLGMHDDRLFALEDCTAEAFALADGYERVVDELDRATAAEECPEPRLIKACGECPFFEDDCLGWGVDHHVLELPRLSDKKRGQLIEAKIVRIADIPANFDLSDNQAIVREAVVQGKRVVNAGALRALLDEVQWPSAFLDFETFKTAIPVFPGIAPHQSLATQYSIHYCDRPGHVTAHKEYLADHRRDSRAELAERLCADLRGARSIISFSGFEKRVLSELAQLCPALEVELNRYVDLLFDLEKCVRPTILYDPAFKGQSSIKVTLPVLVKGLGYEGLDIADGDHATAAFAKMAWGQSSEPEIEKTRRDLLAYCGVDTLGMVKLHEALLAEC